MGGFQKGANKKEARSLDYGSYDFPQSHQYEDCLSMAILHLCWLLCALRSAHHIVLMNVRV